MSGVFFNGRMWISPATMSLIDDSAMYNKNLSVGNVLAVIGRSVGGEPKKALRFGSADEAKAALIDGDLLRAIEKAFDPSAQTGGPALVIGLRVNPATQSSLPLKDAENAEVIGLVSTDFGLRTQQIKVKIEDGTDAGKKLTTQFGSGAYYTADNVTRNAFSVSYSGPAENSPKITVNNTAVVLSVAGKDTAIDLSAYGTIQEVVDRINGVVGFFASVQDGNGEKPAFHGLDAMSNVAIGPEGVVVTGTLQAIVDWFNGLGEGFVTATRQPAAGTVPANIDFTYLAGGTDGNTTASDWSDCFTVLQGEDVQWVTPASPSAAIHAMASAHCSFMSNIARMERRTICGTASGTTDDAALDAAKALNDDRTALVHLGFYDYGPDKKLKLFEPYILAAQIAGAFSGVNPGTALTNKTLKVRGLERKLRNPTDTDKLIEGGVLCVEDTKKGYKVVKSISTWLVNDNYNRVEISTGVVCDFVARNVRDAVDDLRGGKNGPVLLTQVIERAESRLRELARPEPMGPGVIVGDDKNPPYRNITASIEGDVTRLEFEASPAIPCNYIPIVVHAVPYSGSASA